MQPEKASSDWLEALKETGRDVFDKTGLPTPANEDWKYTSLRPYEREEFTAAHDGFPEIDFADLPEKQLDTRIVFINGRYVEKYSDKIDGLDIVNLQRWLETRPEAVQENLVDLGQLSDMPLKAENTAHICDGAALVVEAGQTIETPIEILYFSTDKGLSFKPKTYLRNLFILKEGASLNVFENFTGNGLYATNHVTDISLHEKAEFRHYRLQDEDVRSYHFAHIRVMQHARAVYETLTMTLGARLSRHDIQTLLIGREVLCNINGLYMLNGVQHYDAKILVDHMEPDGISNQLYKGILDDKTRAVFQGKIHLCRAAQGTDGRQLNHALLLSDKAEIDAKPELEIYADNVQCAHGATSGALDEDPLFYMRSRGIPEDEARRLLMMSFLSEVVETIDHPQILDIFRHLLETRLAKIGQVV